MKLNMERRNSSEDPDQHLIDCAERHVANDPVRRQSLDRIRHAAQTNHGNEHSRELENALDCNNPSGEDTVWSKQSTIEGYKRSKQMTRVGDVVFLPEYARIIVIGDTHADLSSTKTIIQQLDAIRWLDSGGFVVFLGDYVHNGVKSWQNILEILRLQQLYPHAVVLLSGNHEFKESLPMALNEYFNVHWQRFANNEIPAALHDRLPKHDNHYGHMRLQLLHDFGYEVGERLYAAYAEWGLRLPYICLSDSLMISHSLGLPDGTKPTVNAIVNGKKDDAHLIQQGGYQAWHEQRQSVHSALVNNRLFSAELLNSFNRLLGAKEFVVGHCHYRSGDTVQYGEYKVTTIVSSSPVSPDSGTYMYQQMCIDRHTMRKAENLTTRDAVAGYFRYDVSEKFDRTRELVPLIQR
ncbi:MAG: putative phosphodiesterase [Pseudomonadales bacterium]|jgi:predicted phosphodiesterase